MKILMTGASGLLGSYMARQVPEGVDADFCSWTTAQPWCRHRLDVTDRETVSYVFAKTRPERVIHAASVGNVDWCERHYTEAERINEGGTKNVVMAAKDVGARVLLVSTNAVYAGDDPPYGEEAERRPVNAYGRQKKRAENFVLQRDGRVVRLFLLYGWEPEGARGNWASSAVARLKAGERLRVVDDVLYQPTYAADAARAVWDAALEWKTANVMGGSTLSLFEFVSLVADAWDLDGGLVERAKIADFPTIAPRPVDSSYDPETGVVCRGVVAGLADMRWEKMEAWWQKNILATKTNTSGD